MRVTVIAANGPSFCAGYDLTQNVTQAGTAMPAADYPYAGAGGFQRSVVDLWTSMWDLSKPVIAQDGRTITAIHRTENAVPVTF